jgi:hypothetical protein
MKSQLLLLLPPPTPLLFALRQFNTKKKKLGIQNRLQLVFRIFADSSHPAPASHTNSPDRDRSAFPTNRVEKNWLSLELFRLFPPPPFISAPASCLSLPLRHIGRQLDDSFRNAKKKKMKRFDKKTMATTAFHCRQDPALDYTR